MLTAERLLDDQDWAGKLYSGGWSDGGGGLLPVLEGDRRVARRGRRRQPG